MTTPTQSTGNLNLPSLLEEEGLAAAPTPGGPAAPRSPHRRKLAALLARARAPENRRTVTRIGVVSAVLITALGSAAAAVALWPRAAPDYLSDPMDQVLDFTLLTDEFNKLPLEKRLELVKDLITRLKNSSSEDSVMMAAFAATIRDKARKQLEENGQRLAMDMLDSYAMDYGDVPPEQQADFLDDKIIEFTRLMEDLSGERSGLSEDPSERLNQLKEQAKRDQQRMSERAGAMQADRVAGFVGFLRDGPAELANPVQQARMTRFTRDMVRHLRGQDISTGRPKGPG